MAGELFGSEQVFGSRRNDRPVADAMKRGFLCRCPKCGAGRLFASYLKTVDHCEACGEEFHHHRADDFPAYLVIVIVGHVIISAWLAFEAMFDLSVWTHLAIWAPLTVISALLLLQPVKGAVVGMQWALRMHGFGGSTDIADSHPEL